MRVISKASATPGNVRVELLEGVVLKEDANVLSRPDRILSEARKLSRQGSDTAAVEAATSELQQVEQQRRRLTRLYVSGTMPEDVHGYSCCRSCLRQTPRALPSVARAPSILLAQLMARIAYSVSFLERTPPT